MRIGRSNGLFRPDRPDAEPWTIVNPPPNVTGALHIGHALDNTLQDICARHARMQGKDALWVVGTDHAGIATQMVVERQLEERQDKRTNYSRDEFIAKVWEWKAESGGEITRQLRRLGCSMDWANERSPWTRASRGPSSRCSSSSTARPALPRQAPRQLGPQVPVGDQRSRGRDPRGPGQILAPQISARGRRASPRGAASPSGARLFLVATTRPETMLADMAVAVHPDDDRYRPIVGKHVRLPISRASAAGAGHHRRACRSRASGQARSRSPGPRLQRFRGRQARRLPSPASEMLTCSDGPLRGIRNARCRDRARCVGERRGDRRADLVPEDYRGLDRFDARKASGRHRLRRR